MNTTIAEMNMTDTYGMETAEKVIDEKSMCALGETLYTAYYTRIHRYFAFRVFDKSEAEDLAQTVFLKIFTSLKKGLWEGTGDIYYIFTVARNTLIDHFRHAKHMPIVSSDMVDIFADSVTTSGAMEECDQRERIVFAMKDLRKKEVQAVTFRFFDDMEYSAIAQAMQIREDAVRQLVHRGLKSLRAGLKLA